MDTIFIILGNKREQFTFLHIYHHVTIYLVYCVCKCVYSFRHVFLLLDIDAHAKGER